MDAKKTVAVFTTRDRKITASIAFDPEKGLTLSIGDAETRDGAPSMINWQESRGRQNGPEAQGGGITLQFDQSVGTEPLYALFIALNDLILHQGIKTHLSLRLTDFTVDWMFRHHDSTEFSVTHNDVVTGGYALWGDAITFARGVKASFPDDNVFVAIREAIGGEWLLMGVCNLQMSGGPEDSERVVVHGFGQYERGLLQHGMAKRAAMLMLEPYNTPLSRTLTNELRTITVMLDLLPNVLPAV